jgi:putative SOS response-associated peptidase YedK
MCGRIVLYTPPERLARIFGADLAPDVNVEGHPRFNIPPTASVLGLRACPDGSAADPTGHSGGADGRATDGPAPLPRQIERFRWGLVPAWAKDVSGSSRTFNARAETVATKPSYRSAFKSRRLVVLADAFYEWKPGPGKERTPYVFQRSDGQPLALAGLWERWISAEGEPLVSCTVITTEAGADMEDIHHRSPVIMEPEALDEWLDPDRADRDELESMLRPPPTGTLVHHQVDRRVGNVRNDGPELMEPIEGSGRPIV